VLFDLDSLKGAARKASPKYRFMSHRYSLARLPTEYAWELAVFANTPGLLPGHICRFMLWPKSWFWPRYVQPVLDVFAGDESVAAAARENAMQVVEQDGLDMLHALVAAHGVGEDDLPLAARMWLQSCGLGSREIGQILGVSPVTVRNWRINSNSRRFSYLDGEAVAKDFGL
jgi:hypothetical protein